MAFVNNPEHFLHSLLTGFSIVKEHGHDNFSKYLSELGIPISRIMQDDQSHFDWDTIEKYWQFDYDIIGTENDIKSWFRNSPISKYEMLITHIQYEDPVIAVKTKEFIEYWEEFNTASAWAGLSLATPDGKYFFEFTDAYKHLNSNFEIKPGTEKKKD